MLAKTWQFNKKCVLKIDQKEKNVIISHKTN